MARKTMTKKQKEITERLVRTGLKRNSANTLVFIAGREETNSKDIIAATGVRPARVSLAARDLKNRGWITKRDIKGEGKGRPMYGYSLNKSIEEIIDDIEASENQRIDEIKKNVAAIRGLVKYI